MAAVSTTPSLSGEKDVAEEGIRLILVGGRGAGKSATGNTILMQERFNESDDPVQTGTPFPITFTTKSVTGRRLVVTDTPDLAKYGIQKVDVKKLHLMGLVSPGPHAILLVISTKERVSQEIQETINTIQEFFADSTDYIIVVFTHVDHLRSRTQSKELTPISEYVKQLKERNPVMKKLLRDCKDRYIGFNNNLPFQSQEQKQMVTDLMEMIVNLFKQNSRNSYYNNVIFENIEAEIKILDEKVGYREKSREVLVLIYMIETVLRQNGDVHITSQEIREVEKDLDEKTGSRTTSSDVMSGVLGCLARVILFSAAGSGTLTALDVGVGIGTAPKIASGAVVGASFGLVGATGVLIALGAIAGIKIAGWKLFKSMKGTVFGDPITADKKYKPS